MYAVPVQLTPLASRAVALTAPEFVPIFNSGCPTVAVIVLADLAKKVADLVTDQPATEDETVIDPTPAVPLPCKAN